MGGLLVVALEATFVGGLGMHGWHEAQAEHENHGETAGRPGAGKRTEVFDLPTDELLLKGFAHVQIVLAGIRLARAFSVADLQAVRSGEADEGCAQHPWHSSSR